MTAFIIILSFFQYQLVIGWAILDIGKNNQGLSFRSFGSPHKSIKACASGTSNIVIRKSRLAPENFFKSGYSVCNVIKSFENSSSFGSFVICVAVEHPNKIRLNQITILFLILFLSFKLTIHFS